MSCPVIGSCLTAALLVSSLRSDYRIAATPSPSGSLPDVASSDDESDTPNNSSGSESRGGFPSSVRKMWPTLSHPGSGYTPQELKDFMTAPPGSVLWK